MNAFMKIAAALAAFGALLLTAAPALSSEYSDAWGPQIGSRLPVLEAPDQAGTIRTLEDLTGERGLLLVLARSADW